MREATDKMSHRESHGGYGSRLYCIWAHIKARCLDKDDKNYPFHGDRGITVCDGWKNSFSAFRSWALQNGYNDELTIDRIDVNGNYEPGNCRWITQSEQMSNTRKTRRVTFRGETLSLKQMAEKYGLDKTTVSLRLKRGWSLESALTTPPGERRDNRKYLTFNGMTLPFSQMAKHYGLKPPTLSMRLKRGMTLEEALTTPLKT